MFTAHRSHPTIHHPPTCGAVYNPTQPAAHVVDASAGLEPACVTCSDDVHNLHQFNKRSELL